MADQESVEHNKAAAAAHAAHNHGAGLDGDGPSVADGATRSDLPADSASDEVEDTVASDHHDNSGDRTS